MTHESVHARRDFLKLAGLGVGMGVTGAAFAAPSGNFDVRTFGAAGDGKALDTAAINKAIDAAAAAGGGTVYFRREIIFPIPFTSAATSRCIWMRARPSLRPTHPPPAERGFDVPEPNTDGTCIRISATATFITASSGAKGWKTSLFRDRPHLGQVSGGGGSARRRRDGQ